MAASVVLHLILVNQINVYTCLTCNDHWLYCQLEKLIQDLVQKQYQRFKPSWRQWDYAQLQLMLQVMFHYLLVENPNWECHPAFQSVTQCKELIQVVVLLQGKISSTGTIDHGTSLTKHCSIQSYLDQNCLGFLLSILLCRQRFKIKQCHLS